MLRRIKTLIFTFRKILPLLLVGVFSIYALGQAAGSQSTIREVSPFELIGWIALTGAGITHVVTNLYNLIRGKNYDQIKESLSNYKELAESRMATIKERDFRINILETENEQVLELALRAGVKELKRNENRIGR